MTVKDLIKELKQYPQDAIVYLNNDWDAVDEEGHFTDLTEVTCTCDDKIIVDMGLDFENEVSVIVE